MTCPKFQGGTTMDKMTEELKRMFYAAALATEKSRAKLEQLKEKPCLRLITALALATACFAASPATCTAGERIIRLGVDYSYPQSHMFEHGKALIERAIGDAVLAGKHRTMVVLHACDEMTANDLADMVEDNGYEIDEEARLLNPFVLKLSWEPLPKSSDGDPVVQKSLMEMMQREAQFEGAN